MSFRWHEAECGLEVKSLEKIGDLIDGDMKVFEQEGASVSQGANTYISM